ncbi:hypothetical protein ACOME3_000322 [Neoechinorhynchus agilis]
MVLLEGIAAYILYVLYNTKAPTELKMNTKTVEAYKSGILQCINLLRRLHNAHVLDYKERKKRLFNLGRPAYTEVLCDVQSDIENLNLSTLCRRLYCNQPSRNILIWKEHRYVDVILHGENFVISLHSQNRMEDYTDEEKIRKNVLPCSRPNECE